MELFGLGVTYSESMRKHAYIFPMEVYAFKKSTQFNLFWNHKRKVLAIYLAVNLAFSYNIDKRMIG